MWLTRLALRYPISTFLFAVTLVVLGLVSFGQLQVDLLPDISIPVVSTVTYYSGAGPLDMEQSVTVITERAVSSVNDVDYIQSTTREGVSRVRINFNWDANVDVGVVDIVQRVNRIINQLPTGVSQPTVQRFDITSQPVCTIALSGEMDERDLYDLAYNIIEPQIEHLSGVASANVSGGRIREIHIVLDRNRLQALQIPVQSVLNAIANSNLIIPSGDLKVGKYDYSLKTESRFNMVKPIESIVVKNMNSVPIRLSDVAKVEDSYIEQTQLIRVDGKPGIMFEVQKLSKANTIDVVDRVMRAIPKLNGIPPTVRMSITFDQSVYIRQTMTGLQHEALIGALLAMAIIFFFLRNIKGTTIILVAIPLSILFTFIFFRFAGITLNIMTFGGLALAIGRLVDDSIVELEAISRHYNTRQKGQSKLQATLDAAKEVAAPIFISTLSTIIVFLPIIFLTGIAKLLFIPLTITIAIALMGSFLVSRTVTPLLCLKFLPPEKHLNRESKQFWDRMQVWSFELIETLDRIYENRLRWALANRKLMVFSIVLLGIISACLFNFIGSEFFPDQDESQFTVNVKLPVGTRVDETDKFMRIVEKIVRDNVPELNTIITNIGVASSRGGGGGGRGNSGSHAGNVQVSLKPVKDRDRSVFEIVKALRPKLNRVAGASIMVNTGGMMKFLMNFGSSAPIDVEIRGYDLETGTKLAKKILGIVNETRGATDAQITREDNLPELRVKIDREKAGVLGVNVAQIANTINTCINGSVASLYTDPVSGNQYNILVRLSEDYRNELDDLGNIVLANSDGQSILLRNIATIERTNSPVQIDRKYQQRLVEVTANVSGRDLGSVAKDIKARLDSLVVPPGFELKLSGNVEKQKQTFSDLLLAFGLAILLVYVVMSSQFQSLLDPFIIMFTVPLGLIGVLWTLFLTNTTLSVTSFQGIIVMVGIVVSNGILLVDFTNHIRRTGVPLVDAVVKAGVTRLKPIIMTSLVTVLGLLPMALSIGGESTQAPLALAVIGGLSVSTLLTLFFVPVMYTIFEERVKSKKVVEEQDED